MPSRRVPEGHGPNAWTLRLAARRSRREPLADLTASNPSALGLSPHVPAAAALAAAGVVAYEPAPLGSLSARAAVADYLASRGLRVEAGDVVLTASTSESYLQLLRLLADPGETIAFPAPGYPLLEPLARAEGIRPRSYRLAWDGAWHLDRESLVSAARGARALVVVEPNNPTGSCLYASDRAFVESTAGQHGCAIVADEVFGDHPWPGHEALPSWLAEPRAVPTFVLGGLSKLCGLPQLKLGWIVAAGPEREREIALAGLEWLADLCLSVGGPVQQALPALLELRHEFVPRARARLGENLGTLDALAGLRPEVSRLPGAGGWSAVLRVPARRTAEDWALALLDLGVAVHPGDFYEFDRGEHLVVSLIAAPDDVRAGCAALAVLLRA